MGKRKSNGWVACYYENKAYFTKNGLSRFNVLHEFYHHLADMNKLELPSRTEEKEANDFATEFIKKQKRSVGN